MTYFAGAAVKLRLRRVFDVSVMTDSSDGRAVCGLK